MFGICSSSKVSKYFTSIEFLLINTYRDSFNVIIILLMECAIVISSVASEVWLLLVGTLGAGWVGFCATAAASPCHLPGQWFIVNWYCNVVSFNENNRLRSLLYKKPNNGLWLVLGLCSDLTMVRFDHAKTNNLALSNAEMAAKKSPSGREYGDSVGDVNRNPVNAYLQLSGQHVGMKSNVHSQYFCKSK